MSRIKVKITRIVFDDNAWEDYLYWLENDIKTFNRINELINDTKKSPFAGLGKPEPLRYALKGWWSRRINNEHRIVYKTKDDTLYIAQLRYYYK